MLALSGLLAASLSAQSAAEGAPAEAPAENPELEAEMSYVEALVNYGYPDLAGPVIEATKKKWPESEASFFAIEIRGLLALGKFEDADKKIAALPDRKSSKYWAARLEMANNYFSRGQKAECMKIYDEFFKVFQKPPADLRKFYMNACYAYGQLLVGDKQYVKAAQRYESLLAQLREGDDQWCNLGCETVEIYLRLADQMTDPKQKKARDGYLKAAGKIVDKLLWQLSKPVYFGRAVSMKAHIEQMKGDIERATAIIDEYKPQLQELHDQIVEYDPDGRQGLLRQSPLPECMYLQAQMRWDEAKAEAKKAKRDDDRIKDLMFGPKGEDQDEGDRRADREGPRVAVQDRQREVRGGQVPRGDRGVLRRPRQVSRGAGVRLRRRERGLRLPRPYNRGEAGEGREEGRRLPARRGRGGGLSRGAVRRGEAEADHDVRGRRGGPARR